MKARHKPFVTKAALLRKSIDAETETGAALQADLSASKTRLKHLRSQLSEVEAEGAEAGLSTAELHEAVDEKLK